MMFQPQPITPVIIKIVPPPTPEVSIVNVLIDALALTGLIAIAAILVGIVLGVALILYKRWRDKDMPGGHMAGIRLDLSSR